MAPPSVQDPATVPAVFPDAVVLKASHVFSGHSIWFAESREPSLQVITPDFSVGLEYPAAHC